jgi:glycosyltransferase involved in cell wall biosynthesis
MKDQPLVSIVLCFYNEQRFLNEAVSSVLGQNYENWELILVDDGSADKSTDMAMGYAENHSDRIRYVDHAGHINKGLSASRNRGLEFIKGDFVSFIDADDVWLPNKLNHQINIFKDNPEATVVVEASDWWHSWNDESKVDVIVPVGAEEGIYEPPQLMLHLYPLGTGGAPCPSGIMIRKDVLSRCAWESSFRGIYQMYEDQAFFCKVYLKETVYVSATCNNRYRQRPASLVSSVHESGKYGIVRSFYLNWFQKYLKSQNIRDKRVKALLEHALMPYQKPLTVKLMSYKRLAKALTAKFLVKLGVLSYPRHERA